MKVYELFNKYTWDDLVDELFYLYPDQRKSIKGYELAFTELKVAATYIISDTAIMLEYIDDEEYHNVYTMRPDDEERYALDMVDWREVLGMDISESALEDYYELDILSHLLFEITFYGYTNKDVEKHRVEFAKTMDEFVCDYGVLM